MDELLRSYTAGAYYSYGYLGTLIAQTFTIPAGKDRVSRFQMKLQRIGSVAGNVTGYLYNTSGGIPTSSLASATYSANSITTASGGEWIEFNISDTAVNAGSRYALVMNHGGTNASNAIAWTGSADGTNPYTDGAGFYKPNGGSWTDWSRDFNFRVYGYLSATAPTVTGGTADNIDETSAEITGNVTSDGGSAITERGVYYSKTDSTPDTDDSKKTTTGTTGSFTVDLTGLEKGTHYYARPYAKNAYGTTLSATIAEFDTLADPPTLTTSAISGITPLQATLNGNITSNEGSSITSMGFVVGSSLNPAIGGGGITQIPVTVKQSGAFNAILSSLSPNTTYHVRAYAINAEGTSYGADVEFTTLNAVDAYEQSFTIPATGTLTAISLALRLVGGSVGKPKVSIWSDSAGDPDTKLADIAIGNITNATYQTIEKTCNIAVTENDVLHIVVEDLLGLDNPQDFWNVEIGANSAGGYADGSVQKRLVGSSDWSAVSTVDMAFNAKIQPTMSAEYSYSLFTKRRYR